jgi:hypothetical protein
MYHVSHDPDNHEEKKKKKKPIIRWFITRLIQLITILVIGNTRKCTARLFIETVISFD